MYHIAICDDSREYISYIKSMLDEAKGDKNIDFKIYEFMSGEELVLNLVQKDIGFLKGFQYHGILKNEIKDKGDIGCYTYCH